MTYSINKVRDDFLCSGWGGWVGFAAVGADPHIHLIVDRVVCLQG
jgi:hypothetical protein